MCFQKKTFVMRLDSFCMNNMDICSNVQSSPIYNILNANVRLDLLTNVIDILNNVKVNLLAGRPGPNLCGVVPWQLMTHIESP